MQRERYGMGVVGLGDTGASAIAFLRARGVSVFAADSRSGPPALQRVREAFPDLEVRLGEFDAARLDGAGTLVVSPGIDTSRPPFTELRARGVELIGDIELFARHANAPVVAVTGSNGKSTVVSLLDAMFRSAGRRVATGGNLGPPALSLLADPPPDCYLLELSSFQLEITETLAPRVAAVLNVAPDHMDRYRSLAEYARAKHRIYRGAETIVRNADGSDLASRLPAAARVVEYFTDSVPPAGFGIDPDAGTIFSDGIAVIDLSEVRLVGRHNHGNAVAALAIGAAAGLEISAMVDALRGFPGLPHRCRRIARIGDVDYVDDSKGTNVAAACAAIEGLGGAASPTLMLIAGGVGKGADFAPLGEACRGRVRHAFLIGEAADEIARELAAVAGVSIVADLTEAVRQAARIARPGDTVLLSPACASFDMFDDYAHRGRAFAEAVTSLEGEVRR